jgi:hypothetical protein
MSDKMNDKPGASQDDNHTHYKRDVSHLDVIDVYRIIDLFGITCPVAQHVLKKAMAAGQRGHKDLRKDWQDIADSANRRLQMMDEDAVWTPGRIKAAALTRVPPNSTANAMPASFGQQNMIEPASEIDDESPRAAIIGQGGEMAEEVYAAIDGWVKWDGGSECPVGDCDDITLRFKHGDELRTKSPLVWKWSHVTAYKIHPKESADKEHQE